MEKHMTFRDTVEWRYQHLMKQARVDEHNSGMVNADGEIELLSHVLQALDEAEHHPGPRVYRDRPMNGIMFDMYARVYIMGLVAKSYDADPANTSALVAALMHELDVEWYG